MKPRETSTSEPVGLRTAALLATNIVALGLYLIAASFGWVERELANIPGSAGGGAIIWFFGAVPVFVLSFFLNFGCVIRALIHRYRTGTHYFVWPAWIAVPGLWTLTVAYDFSRHGI